VGLEFDSVDAAEYEAARGAAEIGRDRLPKGDAREVTVELRNEYGQRVLTVTVSMEIKRVDPPPQPRARKASATSRKCDYGACRPRRRIGNFTRVPPLERPRRATAGLITLDRSLEAPALDKGLALPRSGAFPTWR
jgi:hypothetical protein